MTLKTGIWIWPLPSQLSLDNLLLTHSFNGMCSCCTWRCCEGITSEANILEEISSWGHRHFHAFQIPSSHELLDQLTSFLYSSAQATELPRKTGFCSPLAQKMDLLKSDNCTVSLLLSLQFLPWGDRADPPFSPPNTTIQVSLQTKGTLPPLKPQ